MQYIIATLGCKVNQYETSALEYLFAKEGFEIVDFDGFADAYVINTCTVTAVGDKKSRAVIRRAKKTNPDAVIAVTGCFPQAFPNDIGLISDADVITGTKNRSFLVYAVKTSLLTKEKIIHIEKFSNSETFEPMYTERFPERTRAYLKIEDGCDRYCSYCIIPYSRGPVRSKPLDDVISQAKTLYQNGYREIVLTGINLSSYGKDLKLPFAESVEKICRAVPDCRIRLGSLEPDLVSDHDIEIFSSVENLCPQFHLALQSGCDETLKRMRRKYTSEAFAKTVEKIRGRINDPSITTDVMTGFPGETEEEFEKSVEFVRSVGFLKVHVFPFSRRKGSKAYDMPGQVNRAEKERRCSIMTDASDESRKAFMQTFIGKTVSVLFESYFKNGMCEGFSENYIPVAIPSVRPLTGEILKIKIVSVDGDRCIGEVIK